MPLRRALALLLAVLVLSLAACTGDSDERVEPPATETATPTATASPTPTAAATPTSTATPTPTPSPTATPAPTPTATATPSPTPTPTTTPTPAATATPTPEPAASPTPSPTTFRYTTYDTTGAVAEPGSYAFLADPADTSSAVTTYEGLRDGTARALRIHETDADGVSRAAFLDTIEVGDLFEWRQAKDCFVRYTVTELLPEPSGTPRRLLGVEWMTYAFQGCQTGSLPASGLMVTFTAADELPLEHLGGTNLTDFAVVHGAWQLVPEGWTGATEEPTSHEPPGQSGESETTDVAVASTFPYWREPVLPEGWGLSFASTGAFDGPAYGYGASFGPRGGVTISGYYATGRRYARESSHSSGRGVLELLVIAGRPALLRYSPPGPSHVPNASEKLWVYDAATESEYVIFADHLAFDKDDVIAIARSLFEPPNPQ